jgi:hypothetical protein
MERKQRQRSKRRQCATRPALRPVLFRPVRRPSRLTSGIAAGPVAHHDPHVGLNTHPVCTATQTAATGAPSVEPRIYRYCTASYGSAPRPRRPEPAFAYPLACPVSRDTPNTTATIAPSAATREQLEDVHVSMCVRFTGTAGVASPRVVCLAESKTSTTRASFTLRTMFSEQDASSQCSVSPSANFNRRLSPAGRSLSWNSAPSCSSAL